MNTRVIVSPITFVPRTGEARMAFGPAWATVEHEIRHVAKFVARQPADREALVEEAMVTLWNTDPTRFDFRNRTAVIKMRELLVRQMWFAWGEETGEFRRMAEAIPAQVAQEARPNGGNATSLPLQ